jgi:hypothetical protein
MAPACVHADLEPAGDLLLDGLDMADDADGAVAADKVPQGGKRTIKGLIIIVSRCRI